MTSLIPSRPERSRRAPRRPRWTWPLATFACAALLPATALAGTSFLAGLHFNGGLPQDALEAELDRDAYGIGAQFFYAPTESPFAIGVDVSWMNYGWMSRKEPFSSTIPDVTVDVETMNNVVQAFFVLRGQVPRGPIQLYGDLLFGLNYLYTETSIQDEDGPFDEVASSTNHDDAALAYGFGGGVMVPFFTRDAGPGDGHPFQLALDLGARYVHGDEAEYLTEDSRRETDGRVVFDPVETRTDLVRYHVGVTARF